MPNHIGLRVPGLVVLTILKLCLPFLRHAFKIQVSFLCLLLAKSPRRVLSWSCLGREDGRIVVPLHRTARAGCSLARQQEDKVQESQALAVDMLQGNN